MSDREQREALRQRALAEIALLDTPPDREFDALARMAQRMLGTAMASITLVDSERQWFKARCGPLATETQRVGAFCPVVFESEAALCVPDALLDPRFADSQMVTGAPHIRYYAGVPVRVRPDGGGDPVTIGTLCVLDHHPRGESDHDRSVLEELARVAEALVEARGTALRAARVSEERRVAVERLERERRQFKQAEQMGAMGSYRYDLTRQVTEWSDGVFAVYELPVGDGVPDGEIMSYYPEEDRNAVLGAVARTLETGEPFEMENDFVTARGNRRRVRLLCEIELAHGQPVALIGLIQDITERHAMEQRLRHQARTDDLTQLANRAEFHRVLDKRLREVRNEGAELAVLLIDLDGFKGVNDALGHAAGDDILRRVADRLGAIRVDGCLSARLGGDEFAVALPPHVSREKLEPLIETLLRNLEMVVTGAGQVAHVSGTIGIAWSSDAGHDRGALLRHADAALYEAKRFQKGTARTYQHDLTSADRLARS